MPAALVSWQDHHTEMYFDQTHVFSMQPPRANWFTQTDLDNTTEDKIISVYRMNPAFWGFELGTDDVNKMIMLAQEIIDTKQPYSIGQLLNILADSIAGIPNYDSVQVFTWSDKRLVCSVAVHAIILGWRNWKLGTGANVPLPYSKLNPRAWDQKFIDKYKGEWPLHTIFPAHPAVSQTHFAGEFNLVGRYQSPGGKRIA